jgi:hypothetical protein
MNDIPLKRRQRPLTDIECQIREERENAIAIATGATHFFNGKEREKWFWLPRSLIEIEPAGDKFIVTLPDWLARDKGLI